MAYAVNEPLHANKVVLDQLMLAFYTTLRESYPAIGENAKMRIFEQATTADLVMAVNSWILDGHKIDRLESTEIEFPATWWEFLK